MNKMKNILKIYGFSLAVILLTSQAAFAQCVAGQTALNAGNTEQAVADFSQCAVNENDEEAQFWLARFYQNKQNPGHKDTMKMLLFYHLAAENGNANAQVALAKVLLKMDSEETSRETLASYMNQMQAVMKDKNMPFKGEMLHPYVLLILAQEDADQKWYYPTTQKVNNEAKIILQTYQVPAEKKASLLRTGSLWKQRKMQETAREVLSVDDYEKFMNTVYPKQGRADAFARQRATDYLKERVEEYLK